MRRLRRSKSQRRTVTLGRFTFRSKKAANDSLRAVRDAHPDYQPILGDDEVDLLLGVVAAHPQMAEKVGVGIASFFVATSPDYPTRCFYLIRTDGSKTDFSWKETLSPTKPVQRLRMCCRNAVDYQKTAHKDIAWPSSESGMRVCPITGESFDRGSAHVDHQSPDTFVKLVDDWLAINHLSIEDIPIHHVGDMRSVDTFLDPRQRDVWRSFHSDRAILRMVSASGNLRQGARMLDLLANPEDSR